MFCLLFFVEPMSWCEEPFDLKLDQLMSSCLGKGFLNVVFLGAFILWNGWVGSDIPTHIKEWYQNCYQC